MSVLLLLAIMFKPAAIVLHVSASTFGDAHQIDRWHKARGWSGIGYHAVILNGRRAGYSSYAVDLDGKIEPGRTANAFGAHRGAHCQAGDMNDVALGVCIVGSPGFALEGAPSLEAGRWGRTVNRPYMTDRQHSALLHLLRTWCARYGIDPRGTIVHHGRRVHTISQHSDHDRGKPLCASINLRELRKQI